MSLSSSGHDDASAHPSLRDDDKQDAAGGGADIPPSLLVELVVRLDQRHGVVEHLARLVERNTVFSQITGGLGVVPLETLTWVCIGIRAKAVSLATWAELWETIVREKNTTAALNLDRKSLILDTFNRIEQTSRIRMT